MAPVCASTLEKPSSWCPFTHLPNSSFIVSTIIDLKLVNIHGTSFSQIPYECPPSINNIFMCASFFPCLFASFIFIGHFFRGLAGACVNPKVFFQTLFLCIHLLVQLLTHFLTDFSKTWFNISPKYALPVILFSA